MGETVKVWEKYTGFQTADAAQSIAYTFNLANHAVTHLDVLVTAINSGRLNCHDFSYLDIWHNAL